MAETSLIFMHIRFGLKRSGYCMHFWYQLELKNGARNSVSRVFTFSIVIYIPFFLIVIQDYRRLYRCSAALFISQLSYRLEKYQCLSGLGFAMSFLRHSMMPSHQILLCSCDLSGFETFEVDNRYVGSIRILSTYTAIRIRTIFYFHNSPGRKFP